MSYYKIIDGIRYDRALLEQARSLITGQGDGRLSRSDLEQLVDAMQDGGGITLTERRTIEYILHHFKVTEAAATWFLDQNFTEKSLDARIAGVIRGRLGLKGLDWNIDSEYLAAQEQLENGIDFEEALYQALHNLIEEAESSTSLRDVISMETDIDLSDRPVIERTIRQWINAGTLYLVPLNYPEEHAAERFDLTVSQWMGEVPEEWIFGLEIPTLTEWLFLSQVPRNGEWPGYSFGYEPDQEEYSVLIDFIVERVHRLDDLEVIIPIAEAKAQRKLGGEVDFPKALREVIQAFKQDEKDEESVRNLVRDVHEEVQPGDFRYAWSYREWLDGKVDEYLNEGMLYLVARSVFEVDEDDLEDVFPPENGEELEENWIFQLSLPTLSDHIFWGIVPRNSSQEAYCYGFN